MRILFLGDVVGRSGRDAVSARLPDLRARWKLDAVIVNAENAGPNGFGLTVQNCEELFRAGADCITTGNHAWDQREIIPYIDREPRVLRPLNYPEGAPGRGAYMLETRKGEKLLVANLMARLYMDALDDPFAAAEKLCRAHKLGRDAQGILIDFHGEAASEKMAMAHYCDGRVSFVVGTHTHIPTSDTQVLPGGTGYQTDAGMCGDYNSVTGMEIAPAVSRFVRKLPGERLSAATGEATLCGVVADIDAKTGLCAGAWPLRAGGRLSQAEPPG